MIIIESKLCQPRVEFDERSLATQAEMPEIIASVFLVKLLDHLFQRIRINVFHVDPSAIYVCTGAMRAMYCQCVSHRSLDKVLRDVYPCVLWGEFLICLLGFPNLVLVSSLKCDFSRYCNRNVSSAANAYTFSRRSKVVMQIIYVEVCTEPVESLVRNGYIVKKRVFKIDESAAYLNKEPVATAH